MRLGTTLTLIVLILVGSGYLLRAYGDKAADLSEAESQITSLEAALKAEQDENNRLRQENQALEHEVSNRQAQVESCETRLSQATPLMAGWGSGLLDEVNNDLLIGLWAGALLTGVVALMILARRKTA